MDASQRCHVDCTQLSTILALLISLNRNFDQVSNLELSLSCFCYICKACFSQCFKNVGILRFLVLETTGITAVDWLLQEKSTESSPEI
jgi:predicted membrane channel-forming protein YqfA (hemolysin III family)